MAKVCILGNGFVGNYIYKYLQQEGIDCEIIPRKILDYTRDNNLRSILKKEHDFIINCVGYNGKTVDWNESKENRVKTWNAYVKFPLKLQRMMYAHTHYTKLIHISSGCIFQGDNFHFVNTEPNFGLFEKDSSFYCKCKHAAESTLSDLDTYKLRIRLPIIPFSHKRNLIDKILGYSKLLPGRNSFTYMPSFIFFLIYDIIHGTRSTGIYNCVQKNVIELSTIKELAGQPIDYLTPIEIDALPAKRSVTTLTGCLPDADLTAIWSEYESSKKL